MYVWPWRQLIFMCIYCTSTWNTNWFGSATLSSFCVFCRVTLWPHRCLSQLVHPPLQSLRSPLKLLLPKGAVCVKTHISPQQMVVSLAILSHQPDCLPGLGHLHASPAGYWHHITLLTRSFLWIKGPQHVFKCRSIPCFPRPLQSILSSTNTPVCDISATTMKRYSALVVASFLLLLEYE